MEFSGSPTGHHKFQSAIINCKVFSKFFGHKIRGNKKHIKAERRGKVRIKRKHLKRVQKIKLAYKRVK